MTLKQDCLHFGVCPKQRMYFKGFCCPKLGQGLKPSAALLYPNIGRVLPPPQFRGVTRIITYKRYFVFQSGIKVYNLVTSPPC